MKIKTSTKEKSVDFKLIHIPEAIYIAELQEIKDVSEGKYGERVAFVYRIIEKDVELALVCYKTEATNNNKLGETITAHGLKINDEEVELDTIIGTKVRAWVEDYEKEVEVDGKKEKQIISTISKVKPLLEEKVVQ